jgi:hypothetical protein
MLGNPDQSKFQGLSVEPGSAEKGNTLAVQRLVLTKRAQSGANWFLWIAGLSLVNTAIAYTGSYTRFIIGLGITQFVDATASRGGHALGPGVLGFDLIAAAILVGFGLLARERREWAFILGMILYALDGLLFLLSPDLFSIGFHLFALYMIYKGLKACEALAKLDAVLPNAPIG